MQKWLRKFKLFCCIIIIFVFIINVFLTFYNFNRKLKPQKDIAQFILKEIKPFIEIINKKNEGKAIFSFNMEEYELECKLLK
jgi:hypothetical protein